MKPSIPKGTRDFSPTEMVRRNYLFDTIRSVFRRYGYLPIETPAMENLSTLMGKYGEEGDKLIFKILNSGDYWSDIQNSKLKIQNSKDATSVISEKALRYDLTVPFARYVVQHQNDITFPFKRYQVQPVWRADRPQKGRYREFYQCDADVVGSDSLLNEVELVQMMDDVFSALKIPVTIKINNRKILQGIAELYNLGERFSDFVVIWDKIDKIGLEGVEKELKEKGLGQIDVRKILIRQSIARGIIFDDGSDMALSDLNTAFLNCKSDVGLKGIQEIIKIANTVSQLSNLNSQIEFDITLARGLNYYTGAIFEVKANSGTLTSSITGGGRYDNLTGVFGLPNVSGVGISFGVDRIFDVMNEQNLYPDTVASSTKVMFVNFGPAEEKYALPLLALVRAAGINSEIYPDHAKIKKQFDYANKKQIPFVIVIGSEEMQSGQLTLKNMGSGEQEKLEIGELIKKIKC